MTLLPFIAHNDAWTWNRRNLSHSNSPFHMPLTLTYSPTLQMMPSLRWPESLSQLRVSASPVFPEASPWMSSVSCTPVAVAVACWVSFRSNQLSRFNVTSFSDSACTFWQYSSWHVSGSPQLNPIGLWRDHDTYMCRWLVNGGCQIQIRIWCCYKLTERTKANALHLFIVAVGGHTTSLSSFIDIMPYYLFYVAWSDQSTFSLMIHVITHLLCMLTCKPATSLENSSVCCMAQCVGEKRPPYCT